MTDDTLETLRTVTKTLRTLHRTLTNQRRQLVQTVGDGVEIEMVAARVGFAIRLLEDARSQLYKLRGSNDEVEPSAAPFTCGPGHTIHHRHQGEQK